MAKAKRKRASKKAVARRDPRGDLMAGFFTGMKILRDVLLIAKEFSIRKEAQHEPPAQTIDADFEVIPDELKQLPNIKQQK